MRADSDNYRQILLSGAPLLDVRAPCEFAEGAFPGAINIPLMNDEERRQVGICYKQRGQLAAIELGHRLVSGDLKAQRIAAWREFALKHQDSGYLYCFRGGLRSRISREWLAESGVYLPIIKGGYKAMRHFCIDSLQRLSKNMPLVLLGGLTGCNKTGFLAKFKQSVDLEKLANHRGSSFGRWPEPQPTQINFENALAIALLRQEEQVSEFVLLEDEARLIGSCSLPLPLRTAMQHAPIVILEAPFEERVEQIFLEYVIQTYAAYERKYADDAHAHYSDYLLSAIDAIRKRLGSERHLEIRGRMQAALDRQKETGETQLHRNWIETLLKDYYDPMYHYQIGKKTDRIIFRGSRQQVKDYIHQLTRAHLLKFLSSPSAADVTSL